MRYLRDLLRVLPGVIGAIFISAMILFFLAFPRVVNWIADQTGQMGDPLDYGQFALHLGIALLIIFPIILFYVIVPLTRLRRLREGQGLNVQKGQGLAFIDTDSVRQQVYTAVMRVADVQRAEVTIENEGGRADVRLNVLTGSSINAAKKKQDIRREIKKVIEDQLGVMLADEPTINIMLERLNVEIPHYSTPKPAPIPEPRPEISAPVQPRLGPPTSAKPVETYREPVREYQAPVETPPNKPISPVESTESPVESDNSPLFTRRPFIPTPLPRPERTDEIKTDTSTKDTDEIKSEG